MKTSDLDFRFLDSASGSQIEGPCLYEYMRESPALREAIADVEHASPLPSRFFPDLTLAQLARLLLALRKAGFPKPWRRLAKESKEQLIWLLAESRRERMGGNSEAGIPPVCPPPVIEPAHFDSLAKDHELPYHWPLEPSEPSLFQRSARSGRKYFFGFKGRRVVLLQGLRKRG